MNSKYLKLKRCGSNLAKTFNLKKMSSPQKKLTERKKYAILLPNKQLLFTLNFYLMYLYYLKFCKLSRLFCLSAWKSVVWVDFIGYAIIFVGSVFCAIASSGDESLLTLLCIAHILWIFGLLGILITVLKVCIPLDVYRHEEGDITLCVYKSCVSSEKEMFELVIHKNNCSFIMHVDDYKVPFPLKKSCCFIYLSQRENGKEWASCNVKTEETEVLGCLLNKILFIPLKPEHGRMNILQPDGTVTNLKGDYYVYSNWHIPDGSDLTFPKGSTNIGFPDDFLFVRNNGVYKTYGFFLSGDEFCGCSEVFISAVIFREGSDRLLLEYDGEKYVERFRVEEAFRLLNDYFLEMTDEYDVGGKVYKYDGKSKSLDVLYKGDFRAIDFDSGQILGSDGQTYGQDTPVPAK